MRRLTSSVLRDPSGPRRRLVELNEDGTPGQPIALRGFNLSGAAKNIGYPFDGPPPLGLLGRATTFLPDLAADGFDLLRVPLLWEFLQPVRGGALDPAIGSAVRALVAHAGELGFRVILDIHQDVLGSYFRDSDPGKRAAYHGDGLPPWLIELAFDPKPGETMPHEWSDAPCIPIFHQWGLNYEFNRTMRRAMKGLGNPAVTAAFQDFAARLAELFAGLNNVLTYEVLNEPFSACMSAEVHAKLATAVRNGLGDSVRAGETPTWNVMPAGDWLDAPTLLLVPHVDDRPNGIAPRSSLPPDRPLAESFGPGYWLLTPHFYDPRTTPNPIFGPQPERYENAARAAESLFARWDVVPVVGEFGCEWERRERDTCHRTWIDAFERRAWSWCLWNFNPDAGPEDDDHWCGEKFSVAQTDGAGGVRRSPAYQALLRPFIRRYGGPLLSTAWDGRRYTARVGKAYEAGWLTELHVPRGLGDFEATPNCAVRERRVVVDTQTEEKEVAISIRGTVGSQK